MTRVGRRPLFLLSSITSTLALLGISLSFYLQWSAVPTLVVLCLFMFCFSVGLGPLTFVVAAEVGGLVLLWLLLFMSLLLLSLVVLRLLVLVLVLDTMIVQHELQR